MLHYTHSNANRCAIIAGNGPSLQEIDYTRLPPPPHSSCNASFDINNYDIFRCNQFYFEDKYYLGKEVKFAFAIPPFLFEQSYTYKTLLYAKEYEIENIVVSDFNLKHMDSFYLRYSHVFDDVVCGSEQLFNLRDFYAFIRYNELYHERRITSGIYMCAFAVALGYKEIYIAGIDLYGAKDAYAFDTMQKNLLAIFPYFSTTPSNFHSKEIDIEALCFLEKHYGVKFYSICPNSPINRYVPLATSQNIATFQVEERRENSIRDVLIPSVNAYERLNYGVEPNLWRIHPLEKQRELDIFRYKQALKNNIIYRLCKDFIALPNAIRRYIKGCWLNKKTQKFIKTNGGGGNTHD